MTMETVRRKKNWTQGMIMNRHDDHEFYIVRFGTLPWNSMRACKRIWRVSPTSGFGNRISDPRRHARQTTTYCAWVRKTNCTGIRWAPRSVHNTTRIDRLGRRHRSSMPLGAAVLEDSSIIGVSEGLPTPTCLHSTGASRWVRRDHAWPDSPHDSVSPHPPECCLTTTRPCGLSKRQ